jgi:hypothetical protein
MLISASPRLAAMVAFAVKGRAEVGFVVIVCCVGNCDVAMGKLRTSGEFVFWWAPCQTVVTYYRLCVSEQNSILGHYSKGTVTLIREGQKHWVFTLCLISTWKP